MNWKFAEEEFSSATVEEAERTLRRKLAEVIQGR
jgi:hypothetical protein